MLLSYSWSTGTEQVGTIVTHWIHREDGSSRHPDVSSTWFWCLSPWLIYFPIPEKNYSIMCSISNHHIVNGMLNLNLPSLNSWNVQYFDKMKHILYIKFGFFPLKGIWFVYFYWSWWDNITKQYQSCVPFFLSSEKQFTLNYFNIN